MFSDHFAIVNLFNLRGFTRGRKINLSSEIGGTFGQHRSGWPFVLRVLQQFHSKKGVIFDTFIERTFCWHPDGPRSHDNPWIGMIHVPPNIPNWFQYEQSNQYIFELDIWKKSIKHCRGLYTLSNHHKKYLQQRLHVPINSLMLPTEFSAPKWSWKRFQANKNRAIVQVGWWLRKLHSIFRLPKTSYRKVFLKITHADIQDLMDKERAILQQQGKFTDSMYNTAEVLEYMPNNTYDRLLTENILMVELYDSSANNTVVECLARATPLLINPLESVVEYLGPDYPLYFSTLEEAAAKAEDLELLHKTHQYLRSCPTRKKVSGRYFATTFAESEIYQNI
jgi:hypothetical protein